MMFQKTIYVRSPKLMQAYRKLACQNCGTNDGSVSGAHSNQAKHGKGKGIKACDTRAASLCHTCHTALDQGSVMLRSERERFWTAAHAKTVRELVRLGLWPMDVPIPDIRTFDA